MTKTVTVDELHKDLHKKLQLRWVAGWRGGKQQIGQRNPNGNRPNLLGLLNLISPNRIQVLGPEELQGLISLGAPPHEHALRELFRQSCQLVILAEDVAPSSQLTAIAEDTGTALLSSPLHCGSIINALGQYLTRRFSESITIHGVLMEVLGAGVLITGDSSVGKSELALELITRGHKLIADDAPEFRKIAHNRVEGSCPELLRDFLEVRGLGVLNIQKMYGHTSTRNHKILRFIVKLVLMDNQHTFNQADRLKYPDLTTNVLGVEISELTIPVAPGRNLAVLVEAAVRNYLLRKNGYDSSADFINRHHELIGKNTEDNTVTSPTDETTDPHNR